MLKQLHNCVRLANLEENSSNSCTHGLVYKKGWLRLPFAIFGVSLMSLEVIILAAGKGTRMCSTLPKVLHKVAGKTMLGHVIDNARRLNPEKIHVVIGHGAEQVIELFSADNLNFVLQEQQLGTGHAVAAAMPFVESEKVLILYGDVPLIEVATLENLIKFIQPQYLGLLTVNLQDPTGYGRIIRDQRGEVMAIVEQKDASYQQKQITEGNTGILALRAEPLKKWLGQLSNQNAQGEYYLTDIIAMAVKDGFTIATAQPETEMEVQGANDRIQLAQLERYFQYKAAQTLMKKGVTLLDPMRFDLRGEVEVGADIEIDINVILEGKVIIEDNVTIGANCIIKNSILKRGVVVKANSHIEGAILEEESDAGPFARIRPNTILHKKAHVGNFVELKNTSLGEYSKVGHLTYLGDTEVGRYCNIGAGTITCNYDGVNKFKTVLGDEVFIGSNNSLVAPVTIGEAATTAAGSTITENVSPNTLAIGRARQVEKQWQKPQKKS